MSIGKIVLLILGVLGMFVGFGLLISGGTLVWFDRTAKDSEGYYTTDTIELERDSYALVSQPAEMSVSGALIEAWSHLATFKVEGVSNDGSKGIFIGIAREEDAKRYIENIRHDEIAAFEIDSADVGYVRIPGYQKPPPPTSQTFWVETANGPGSQGLYWKLESGSFLLVLMNEDGSPGVDVSTKVGAKVPGLIWIGVGVVIGGIFVLVAASVLVYLGVRRKRTEVEVPGPTMVW